MRLGKLGVGIPAWLIDPDTPAAPGDGRPKTPIPETASFMLRMEFEADGKAKRCEVLMSNSTPELGAGFCSTAMTMRFQPEAKAFDKIFWLHAHRNEKTGDAAVEIGPFVERKARR